MAKLRKLNVPYTQVVNQVIYDKNLSLKAKGMFAYIQAKPDGYDFSTDRIPLENKDGRDSVRSAISELINQGYLVRFKMQDGSMEYALSAEKCKVKIPQWEFPTDGKAHSGKSRRIINKESYKERIYINKELLPLLESRRTKGVPDKILKEVESKFTNYWNEELVKGIYKGLSKWQGEKSWDLEMRLNRFFQTTKSYLDWEAENEKKKVEEEKMKLKKVEESKQEYGSEEERKETLKKLREMKLKTFNNSL